ncbi:HD-GYP domain-containing protein [Pullulanibacillus sp. KACC 23026]|uniref:HD-GYP domain-containing protein n=1 Tax=Pullulanibacillus sp. KACC 23026 TaxID=3028315 RepID=UPI0023B0EAE8|nr:HD-GYP domain-containing protein [Pullulanibacillus sp. KACC 23026]WEG13454.1 HD-GYP domain-containing protein [Pullulanibacillus sp. KACC 23026]
MVDRVNNTLSKYLVHQSPYLSPTISFFIKYRYLFFIISVIGIWFDKNVSSSIGIYSLIMVFFGLVYPHLWQGIHQSFLATLLRFYHGPEGFPGIDIFLFQWLSYLAIWFAVSSLVKKNSEQKDRLISITTSFAAVLDARDKYTAFHSENVARLSVMIAKELGLPDKECNQIKLGAHLHDIGKIGIPEHILNNPSKLTEEDYEIIKTHPILGYNFIKELKVFEKQGVFDAILYHHEREDGTGYPEGLTSGEIPQIAKIIAVADSFDAMTSRRIYRKENSFDFAVNEIIKNKGNWYDTQVVNAFERIIEREGERLIAETGGHFSR